MSGSRGNKICINGEFVDEAEAKVSVRDRGFLYGDGVFETLRSYGGRIFRVRDHLTRLADSARRLHLSLPWSREALTGLLEQALQVNGLENAVLRLSLSRGTGPPGLDIEGCGPPTLVLLTRSFDGYPEAHYRKGAAAVLVGVQKIAAAALDPGIKSSNYLNNILARIEARQAGADEGILLNAQGFLAEGTVSNIFFVRDGMLYTPSVEAGILPGLTRRTVLEIAGEQNIPCREGLFRPSLLETADEAFLTNTTYEVMPLRRLNRTSLSPGPMGRRLREAFGARVREEKRS